MMWGLVFLRDLMFNLLKVRGIPRGLHTQLIQKADTGFVLAR